MKRILTFAFALIALTACKKENNEPTNTGDAESGADNLILVANEGPFQSGSGTITRINITSGDVEQEVFQNTNGFPLGNIVQSTQVHDNQIYVMVNNSSKIEVVEYPGFTSTATINGLGQPRYMVTNESTGYVSDYTDNGVHVIDLESNSVSTTISTGNGPDDLLVYGDKLFVANSGGFGTDNRVSVIDLNSNSVMAQIEVGDNPHALEMDNQGNLRVLCRGVSDWQEPENDTPGALVTIDVQSLSVTQTMAFGSQDQHPSHLTTDDNGHSLYYLLNGAIYRLESTETELPNNALVAGNFYSLWSHPEAQNLIATDAMDYQSDGEVYLFDWGGNQEAVFDAGVIPSHVLPL